MANKLQKAMKKIVGPFQSAFLKGRAITDNYIVAHETLHSFEKKRKLKYMALKLDMAQACDRME